MLRISETIKTSDPKTLKTEAKVIKVELIDNEASLCAIGTIATRTIDGVTGDLVSTGRTLQAVVALEDMPNGDQTTIAQLCDLLATQFTIDQNAVVTVPPKVPG